MIKIEPYRDMALQLVDLDRYPIADLDSGAGAQFLAACQSQIDTHGWCNFDGFIKPSALAALAEEANALMPHAEKLTIKRTIYQGQAKAGERDLRAKEYTHRALQLADDQIPRATMLQQLYRSDILTEFVRRVQKKTTLYHCPDQFQALNVVALEQGNWHAWHYDVSECTVTLLLQAADAGGEFTFLPNSRTNDWEDVENVSRILEGDLSVASSFARGAGCFTLFRGGYSLHGVTKVEGPRPRITAILTYDAVPGVQIADDVNIRIYGKRAEEILARQK